MPLYVETGLALNFTLLCSSQRNELLVDKKSQDQANDSHLEITYVFYLSVCSGGGGVCVGGGGGGHNEGNTLQ